MLHDHLAMHHNKIVQGAVDTNDLSLFCGGPVKGTDGTTTFETRNTGRYGFEWKLG